MVQLGSNGERYIPASMPSYNLTAKKTIQPSSRVVSTRVVTTPTTTPTNFIPTAAPTSYATTATPSLPATPSYNGLTSNYLNQLTSGVNQVYNQQRAATLAQLQADNKAAVNKLNTQKKEVSSSFQGQRNQADVIAAQNVQKLRELMAANGLNASGENVTATAAMNSDRQGAINELNLQEQSAMRDINNQINDINNPARQQAALAQIEANRANSLVETRNTAEEKAWREYTYKNMSAAEKSQLEWAKQQYGEDAAWRMFELQYNGNVQLSTNQAQIDSYTGALAGIP